MSLPGSLFKELPLTGLSPGQTSSLLLPALVMNSFFTWSLPLATTWPFRLECRNCSSIKPSVNHRPLNMLLASCTCRVIILILVPCRMAKTLRWIWGDGKRSHPSVCFGACPCSRWSTPGIPRVNKPVGCFAKMFASLLVLLYCDLCLYSEGKWRAKEHN